jgi:NAD+ kinase
MRLPRVAGVTRAPAFDRIALVVHPTRAIENALDTLRRWTDEHGIGLVQLATEGVAHRDVAAPGEVAGGDLVVAVGGDGTVLAALRAAAAAHAPVLGVACGSLGALSVVSAERTADALERFRAGAWTPRSLPALAIAASDGSESWALNDFVVIRRGSAQLAAAVTVDDEPYVRMAGDGLIVATALGSTAYSMAAGGPVMAANTPAFVCTPIAMHGGTAPPLVVPAGAMLTVEVNPGYTGFDVEIDGHRRTPPSDRFELTLDDGKATLVTFDAPGPGIAAVRRRRLIVDSPRILARDDRAPRAVPGGN